MDPTSHPRGDDPPTITTDPGNSGGGGATIPTLVQNPTVLGLTTSYFLDNNGFNEYAYYEYADEDDFDGFDNYLDDEDEDEDGFDDYISYAYGNDHVAHPPAIASTLGGGGGGGGCRMVPQKQPFPHQMHFTTPVPAADDSFQEYEHADSQDEDEDDFDGFYDEDDDSEEEDEALDAFYTHCGYEGPDYVFVLQGTGGTPGMIRDILNAADETIDVNGSRYVDPYRIVDIAKPHLHTLFTFNRKWYTPLLKTSNGIEILARLLHGSRISVNDNYDAEINLNKVMSACLHIQSMLAGPYRHDYTRQLLFLLTSFRRSFFEAIRRYIHPSKARALDKLKTSLGIKQLPHHHVPSKALPLLFPNIDTTQFAPQFGWFLYLVNQFSSVDERSYPYSLSALLNRISNPTALLSLKPGLTLDSVFAHNHIINSYDEFLHYKLPQVLPQLKSATNYTLPSFTNLLFPYFPNQPPLLPLSYNLDDMLWNPTTAFQDYFIHMFVLGPIFQTTAEIPSFETTHLSTSLSLSTKLAFHQHRAWYHANFFTSVSNHVAVTNKLPLPSFTASPFTLLPLTVRPKRPLHLQYLVPSNRLAKSFDWYDKQPPVATQAYYRFVFHILSHYYPNGAARDAMLDKVVLGLLRDADTLPVALEFSISLYQHGYVTIHQHAYRILTNNKQNKHDQSSLNSDAVVKILHFLLQPLLAFHSMQAISSKDFTQHITLCVHAGFLSPPPSPSPSPPPLPNPPSTSASTYTTAPFNETESDAKLAFNFFRSFLQAVLVRLTGFISYFPQSTQLLATAVYMVAPQVDSSLSRRYIPWTARLGDCHLLPFLPPHSSAIPDPRDSLPQLKAALVDDEGKLYAVKYANANDEPHDNHKHNGDTSNNNTTTKKHIKPDWITANFPFRGAPRHKHILDGAVIDDLLVCVNWSDSEVGEFPELLAHLNCPPYSRPHVIDKDMAWTESEDNQKNLKLPETRELQKKLTAYYRQVNEVETAMVVTQMHKVLTKAYETGLCDASNAGQKRKRPPPSSSHNPPTNSASDAAYPSPFRSPHPTYPLPNLPKAPNMVQMLKSDLHDTTYSQPRGTLSVFSQPKDYNPPHFHLRGLDWWGDNRRSARTPSFTLPPVQGNASIFLDHNYAATFVTGDSISELPADTPKDHFGERGRLKTDGSVSMVGFFRQRSEWALELLIVGCFGLDAASTQRSRPAWTTNAQPSPLPTHNAPTNAPLQTSTPPPPPHIQQCKDHILQHLPILLNTIAPPTTGDPRRKHWDPTLPQDEARLSYYYDTITHLALLTTLPLYDTLISLPSPSL